MERGAITKALEVWTLQGLLDTSIFLGIVALGLVLVQKYLQSLREYLTLRVSTEVWNLATILIVDVVLAIVVLVGLLVLNPDIMADIKVAIPFVPLATIIFAIVLVLRLFHGAHQISHPSFRQSVWLMVVANAMNLFGYSFVMEAPSSGYLEDHPIYFWIFLKTHLRSDSNLGLSQIVFLICFPVLLGVFIWGLGCGIRQIQKPETREG